MIRASVPSMVVTSSSSTAQLRDDTGDVLVLPGYRWIAEVDDADEEVLAHSVGPVLDLGCGPGRHVLALVERGIAVLGVELSRNAVGVARSRGLPVLERSVFDCIPMAGKWGSVLLLDGNIGIGGDPIRLLGHASSLVRSDGFVLVEVASNSARSTSSRVRLEIDGEVGPWFDWSHVEAEAIPQISSSCGLRIAKEWSNHERHFFVMEKSKQ